MGKMAKKSEIILTVVANDVCLVLTMCQPLFCDEFIMHIVLKFYVVDIIPILYMRTETQLSNLPILLLSDI